jgi:hypothetical protein
MVNVWLADDGGLEPAAEDLTELTRYTDSHHWLLAKTSLSCPFLLSSSPLFN